MAQFRDSIQFLGFMTFSGLDIMFLKSRGIMRLKPGGLLLQAARFNVVVRDALPGAEPPAHLFLKLDKEGTAVNLGLRGGLLERILEGKDHLFSEMVHYFRYHYPRHYGPPVYGYERMKNVGVCETAYTGPRGRHPPGVRRGPPS